MFTRIKKFFSGHSCIYPEEAIKRVTKDYAINKASKCGLEKEVAYCINNMHMWPIEALDEWDLLNYENWS